MVPFHTQNLKQRPQFEWNNSGRPSADGHDHHHVGARSHLPYAVEVDELREGEPVVDLFGSWARCEADTTGWRPPRRLSKPAVQTGEAG
jgi:hypothetical protein